MAECLKCGDEYPDKRKEIGYDICLKCGAEKAREQAIAKSKRIAVVYNKGSYQYITDGEKLEDLGK